MGRKVKDASLQNRDQRSKLKQRDEPYWRSIAEGLHIGYRKGARGGAWRVRLFVNGKYVKRALGAADDVLDANGVEVLNWSQAQEAAQQFEKDSNANDGRVRGPLTVAHATERYLEWFHAHHKPQGYATANSYIRAHILPSFADREISSITSDEIEKWLHRLATKPALLRTAKDAKKQAHREKPHTEDQKRARKSTANRVLTVFKAILNKAFRDDLVENDAAWRRVKPFSGTDDGEIRYLKPAECTRLVNACPPNLRALVRGALYTGARYGELARLRVSDVNIEEARIYISPAAKSGKGRHVPLSPEGVKLFADLVPQRSGADLVFLKENGTGWGHNHHMRAFVEANKHANITPPARFHDLRHSYATMVANIPGNTLDVLAEILGHADTRITRKHYAFLFDDTKKRAVANMPSLGYASTSNVKTLVPKVS